MENIKEKIIGASGGVTGSLSVLGSYQVCHNACLALVAFLTFLGFAVAGMPLLFLTKVAVPFWIAALSLLAITIILNYKKIMKISNKMLLLNSGLIIAGTPFQSIQQFSYFFWITGGSLVLISVVWYLFDRFKSK